MNLGSKGISGNVLQNLTRHTKSDLFKNKILNKLKDKHLKEDYINILKPKIIL